MPLLAIERSTHTGSVAILARGDICAHRSFDDATSIAAVVAELLEESRLTPTMIARCAIGLGPGSFAGIRGALAFLQGFAAPARIPVIGLSSAAAMALDTLENPQATIPNLKSQIAVLGDARRGHYWVTSYELRDNSLVETLPLRLIPYGQSPRSILPNHSWISPDIERITESGADLGITLHPATPDARAIARLALDDHEGLTPITPPLPVYLHHPVRATP